MKTRYACDSLRYVAAHQPKLTVMCLLFSHLQLRLRICTHLHTHTHTPNDPFCFQLSNCHGFWGEYRCLCYRSHALSLCGFWWRTLRNHGRSNCFKSPIPGKRCSKTTRNHFQQKWKRRDLTCDRQPVFQNMFIIRHTIILYNIIII